MRTKQSASILPQKFFAIRGPGMTKTRGKKRVSIVANVDPTATASSHMCADVVESHMSIEKMYG